MGKTHAKDIIASLKEGESIKFVTNSMGAAYQKGFSQALVDYVTEYNQVVREVAAFEGSDYSAEKFIAEHAISINIEFVVDIAGYTGRPGTGMDADPNAKTNYFMRSKDDLVAGYKGAEVRGGVELAKDKVWAKLPSGARAYPPEPDVNSEELPPLFKMDLPTINTKANHPHHASWWNPSFFPRSQNNDSSVKEPTILYEQGN